MDGMLCSMTFLQHLLPKTYSKPSLLCRNVCDARHKSFAASRANTSAALHLDMALPAARAASSAVVHTAARSDPGRDSSGSLAMLAAMRRA